jgi:alkanesulfonate monooxygenase SsuD/methylene tetrahydromethanopterin reductase-like flavin-dependent oxidoreductase (luciferase family)
VTAEASSALRVGVFVPAQFVPFREAVEQCQFVEALGYDSLWIADHFVNPLSPNKPMHEPWTLLAGVAARTTRIRLGTLVTSFIYRLPALVAKQALTVEHISEGRLELGLGAGERATDRTMTGSAVWGPRERVERFREAVVLVDRLLPGEPTTFAGRYYQAEDALLRPPSIQRPRPPLTLGGSGPKLMALIAQHADTWNTLDISLADRRVGKRPESVAETLAEARQQQEMFDALCVEHGRQPRRVRRSVLLGYSPFVPTDSVEGVLDLVGRYREIGITDITIYWLPDQHREQLAGYIRAFGRSMLERVAAALPRVWQ